MQTYVQLFVNIFPIFQAFRAPRLLSRAIIKQLSSKLIKKVAEMLTNKIFLKKTKKGSILKIVREHYLRDDIACGSSCCEICVFDEKGPVLNENPHNHSLQFTEEHYIIPDTNVVIHQVSSQ